MAHPPPPGKRSCGQNILIHCLGHPLPASRPLRSQDSQGGAVLFSVALTTSAAVQLVTLRATLTIGGQSVTMMHDGYHFKVTNCSIMCHASNMLIWTSALPNAGQGAFVRSRLAHQLADPFIRKDEVICGYSSSNITDSELASLNT